MEIRRYILMLQRWAWLVVVGAVVAGGTAYLININTKPIYQASARLLIDEAPTSGGNEYAQALFEERLATTYVELLALYPVLSETVERLDLDMDPAQLKKRLNVTAASQAQIIIISVEDEDPTRAALIANTVGDVFMDLNQERESARFATSIASYDEQMERLQAEISEVERQIIELGEPDTAEEQVKLAELETARREAQIRYTEAFNTRESLRVEQARISNNLIPVEPARVPDVPIRPRVRTNTILGAAVGAILALGVVFLVEYMDDTIKTPEQVRQVADISTLAAIYHIRGNGNLDSWLVTHHTPRAPVSEAFRMLRTNLSFSAVDEALHTMVVTSSSPGEGKSTISANLAVVMAQTGKQVILVDADLRRPTQHKLFNLGNNHGLTSTLLDPETPIEHQLQPTKVQGLRVLTSGPIPPNPAELLNSQRMDQIVRLLESEADAVIFDTPPVLSVADATILAPKVSGCVLVVDAGRIRPQMLSQAVERLRNANTHLLGAVLNQLKVRRSGYYYYDYYRYYDYDHVRPGTARRGGLRLPGWLAALSRRS